MFSLSYITDFSAALKLSLLFLLDIKVEEQVVHSGSCCCNLKKENIPRPITNVKV